MKNVIVTSIVTVLLCAAASGQQANRPVLSDNMQSLHMSNLPVNKIHVRAMRDFLKRNKANANNNADWTLIETGYVVKYTSKNNSNCRTVYNKRGEFVYTLRQYYENVMSRDVRSIVKSQYYDYAITLVEELEVPMKPLVYIVHIEDSTSLMNVRVSEREMEVMSAYRKSE